MDMKKCIYLVIAIIGASGIGYSVYTADRVSHLERRLQHVEAMLQPHIQLAETRNAAPVGNTERIMFFGGGAALGQRVPNIENKIEPHLEVLPPYIPPDEPTTK
jgi:hypothetical protein